jgi:predicted RND superfamily exporter protein
VHEKTGVIRFFFLLQAIGFWSLALSSVQAVDEMGEFK